MLSDAEFDRLYVMSDLMKTMLEAYREELVNKYVAEAHVTLYSTEIASILQQQKTPIEQKS